MFATYLDYLFIEISKFRPVMTFVTSMTFCDVTDVRRLTLRPKTRDDHLNASVLNNLLLTCNDAPASILVTFTLPVAFFKANGMLRIKPQMSSLLYVNS
jgi:hypothetical protein